MINMTDKISNEKEKFRKQVKEKFRKQVKEKFRERLENGEMFEFT